MSKKKKQKMKAARLAWLLKAQDLFKGNQCYITDGNGGGWWDSVDLMFTERQAKEYIEDINRQIEELQKEGITSY